MIFYFALGVEAIIFIALTLYTNSICYKHGIWDGAFNHFLSYVQKQMRYYDPHRAAKILDEGKE